MSSLFLLNLLNTATEPPIGLKSRNKPKKINIFKFTQNPSKSKVSCKKLSKFILTDRLFSINMLKLKQMSPQFLSIILILLINVKSVKTVTKIFTRQQINIKLMVLLVKELLVQFTWAISVELERR